MIAIYSKEHDQFVNDVINCLGDTPFFRISKNSAYKQNIVDISTNEIRFKVSSDYQEDMDLNRIKSIWFNGGSLKNDSKDTSEISLYLLESNTLTLDAFLAFFHKDIRSIGSKLNNKKSNKVENLLLAKKNGLNVPKTFITKNKEDIEMFLYSNEGMELVTKRINENTIYIEEKEIFDISKTILVNRDKIKSFPKNFGLSLFQERIEKKFEVRSILFNGTLYSAAIFDFSENVDYRKNLRSKSNKPRIVPFDIPLEIEQKIKKLMSEMECDFGIIDLICDQDDNLFFLEVNPCGQISFINNACNFNLEFSFAEYLMSYEKN